jgi:hypothetical protein
MNSLTQRLNAAAELNFNVLLQADVAEIKALLTEAATALAWEKMPETTEESDAIFSDLPKGTELQLIINARVNERKDIKFGKLTHYRNTGKIFSYEDFEKKKFE